MMFKVIATIAACVLAATSVATVADANEIAGVVAALNERAVAPAPDGPADDGSAASAPDLAAWTVGTPGWDGGDCFIDVAVLGAATAAQTQDVVNHLSGDSRIASVTGIVITTVTPTLAELQVFDAVLVFTNSTPQSSVVLGDNLADYVDGGGGVVLTMFAIRATVANRTVEGRFLTDNYYCIERSVGSSTTGNATLGTIHVPGHPLLTGVTTFDGGSSSFRSPAALNASATRVADWSTGQILMAERTNLGGGRVDLGFFAVSQLASSTSWLVSTDGAAILRNSVVVASRCGQATAVEPTTWGAIKAQQQ
jgi:hypothetical protein